MAYNREIYARARAEIEKRRRKAEDDRRKRHDEICLKFPEVLDCEKEMARTGAEAVKAIGLGEEADAFIEKISRLNLAAQKVRERVLTENGYPGDYLDTKYYCKKCNDTGYCGQRLCSCYHELVKKFAFEELEKASPMTVSSFDTFKLDYYPDKFDINCGVIPREHMKFTRDFCIKYAEEFTTKSRSLLMYGRTGLGKTHLSLAIAREVTKKGYSVIYDSVQNILSKIEKEHFNRASSAQDTLSAVCECDLLILDDLGAEFQTSFTTSMIYNIINNRILLTLPTIISTNLDNSSIEERYSERIASRIAGNYINLGFCGNDIRQLL